MGLKARKIKTMFESHLDTCVEQMNSKLGTNFKFEVDWSCIPEDIDGWNWDDEDLKTVFYNSYVFPFETHFAEMFKDPTYKEEIPKQIHTISIQPGRSMVADFDFNNGTLILQNTLCVNQKSTNSLYFDAAYQQIQKTIDSKLT